MSVSLPQLAMRSGAIADGAYVAIGAVNAADAAFPHWQPKQRVWSCLRDGFCHLADELDRDVIPLLQFGEGGADLGCSIVETL